jgi:Uncharacterised nucleotidyltransferase
VTDRPPATARTLSDAWARITHAQVHHALAVSGIDHLFIKGPTVADWLYALGERPFVDVDVLVAPGDLGRTLGVLAEAGYDDTIAGTAPGEAAEHSHPLRLRDGTGVEVDVHDRFPGFGVAAADVWRMLHARRSDVVVAHVEVPAPDRSSRLLLIALHAARDGRRSAKARADVERAVKQPVALWRDAVDLARRLDALPALRAGLAVVPPGAGLADELGLPRDVPASWTLASESADAPTIELARLLELPWRRRFAVVAREIVPTPAFMRIWSPEAARSRRALSAAYVRRLAGLARRVPRDLRAVRAARRAAR